MMKRYTCIKREVMNGLGTHMEYARIPNVNGSCCDAQEAMELSAKLDAANEEIRRLKRMDAGVAERWHAHMQTHEAVVKERDELRSEVARLRQKPRTTMRFIQEIG